MDKTPEATFVDALEAAGEEAISEIEAQSEAGEIEDGELTVEDDHEEIDEAAGDEAEDDLSEPEDEEQVDVQEEGSDDATFTWDGTPESLTDEAKQIYDVLHKDMRDGVNVWQSKKASEWGVRQQAFERRIQELEAVARRSELAEAAPKEPARPGENATQAEVDKYYDDRAKFAAYQQTMDMVERGIIPGQHNAPPAPGAPDPAMEQRILRVQAQPGYNEDIDRRMYELAQSSPHWLSQTQTDDGMMALFDLVKTQVEAAAYKEAAAKASTAEIQRKASAPKRKVSKPRSAPKRVTPARNYADMGFDEKLEAATDDAFRELGLK
jgi:hypothetical protein